MDTTLCYLICLSCLPQTVHTSRDCAVLNVMGQYTVDQDTTAGCCAGRMPRIADACSSCGLDTEKCGRRCSSTDAVSGQDGLAAILRRCAARRYRRYGRVCCCCRRLVSRCLRFYNLRFIGRGKKPLAHPSLLPRSSYPALALSPVRREGSTGPERPQRRRPDGQECYVESRLRGARTDSDSCTKAKYPVLPW